MGIAALVLGIVSIIISFIPFLNVVAFMPAMVGLILGIIDIVKKTKNKEPKGKSIAGTILSAIAMVIIVVSWISMVALVNNEANDILNKAKDAKEQTELMKEQDRKLIEENEKKRKELESSYNYKY